MRGKRQVGLKLTRHLPTSRLHLVKTPWANSSSTETEIGQLSLTLWNYPSRRSRLLTQIWRKMIKVKLGSIQHQAQRPKELMMRTKTATTKWFWGQLGLVVVSIVFTVQTQTSRTAMIKRSTKESRRKCKIIKGFSKT